MWRTLVRAVRQYDRILQVGSQQRSMVMDRMACDFVRNGGLGRTRLVLGANDPPSVKVGPTAGRSRARRNELGRLARAG